MCLCPLLSVHITVHVLSPTLSILPLIFFGIYIYVYDNTIIQHSKACQSCTRSEQCACFVPSSFSRRLGPCKSSCRWLRCRCSRVSLSTYAEYSSVLCLNPNVLKPCTLILPPGLLNPDSQIVACTLHPDPLRRSPSSAYSGRL